jgi:uncharacterized protein (TIGR00251 family)
MSDALSITAHEDGSILPVVAHPGARRNAVLGVRAGALRVAVTAPPDKGKANAAIQSLLAEALDCKPARVELVSGATSRQKRFRIGGVTPEVLRVRLTGLVPTEDSAGFSLGDAETQRRKRRLKK